MNRYTVGALFGIAMIDVLTALEHLLINISELWSRGVLEQFWDRALLPLLFRSVSFSLDDSFVFDVSLVFVIIPSSLLYK